MPIPAPRKMAVARDSWFHIHRSVAANQPMMNAFKPASAVGEAIATVASGSGSVERNPGRRGLASRWKVNGRMPSKVVRSIQPKYSSACVEPVRGNLRQLAIRLGRKAKAIIQRNPRLGFCVLTNQTPVIGPVNAPTKGRKKPRTKRLATAQATICDQRVERTFVVIVLHNLCRRASDQMAGAIRRLT